MAGWLAKQAEPPSKQDLYGSIHATSNPLYGTCGSAVTPAVPKNLKLWGIQFVRATSTESFQ